MRVATKSFLHMSFSLLQYTFFFIKITNDSLCFVKLYGHVFSNVIVLIQHSSNGLQIE